MKKVDFLIVDDSKAATFFNQTCIKRVFEEVVIETAQSGEKALKLLKSEIMPAVILLDLNMPVMDGWEFIEEFKKFDVNYRNEVNIVLNSEMRLSDKEKDFVKNTPEIKQHFGKMLSKDDINSLVANFITGSQKLCVNL
ncbi:response regulator [Aquimarina agarilytica]|uniref:response regulator n=1 Tax=Aquimarina agarilytica TaxID=1087449 RepID=UPI000288A54D|nr:response regulator [Aquimarina agarilytica]